MIIYIYTHTHLYLHTKPGVPDCSSISRVLEITVVPSGRSSMWFHFIIAGLYGYLWTV